VGAPHDPENRLECVCGDPVLFKNLFAYLKNLKAREVHVRCDPRGLTFFARDQSRAIRVVGRLPGAEMVHHYCEGRFRIGLHRAAVEKVFASIDASFYKVTLLYLHEEPDKLVVIFKDHEVDKDCSYRLTLSDFEPDEGLYAAEEAVRNEALEAFPLSWELSARQFKKSVGDAANHSEVLTVSKLGDEEPLRLTYNRVNQHSYEEVYRDPQKIALRSYVAAGEVFSCDMPVRKNVRPVAASMVADRIRIYCGRDGSLVFQGLGGGVAPLELCSLVAPAI
jgi:hypothetical protein